jgi:hypothetical protein
MNKKNNKLKIQEKIIRKGEIEKRINLIETQEK